MPLSFNPHASAGGRFYSGQKKTPGGGYAPRRRPVTNAALAPGGSQLPPGVSSWAPRQPGGGGGSRPARRMKNPVTNQALGPWSQLPPGVSAWVPPGFAAPVTNEALGPWSQLPPGVVAADPTPVPTPPASVFDATAPPAGVAPADTGPVPGSEEWYALLLEKDPTYQALLYQLNEQRGQALGTGAEAISGALGMYGMPTGGDWQRLLIDSGLIDPNDPTKNSALLGGINWDEVNRLASGKSEYGNTTTQKLAEGHRVRQGTLENQLAARGIYRSGETASETNLENREYARQQDDALTALLGMLTGEGRKFAEGEANRIFEGATGLEAAKGRAWDTYGDEDLSDEPVDEAPEAAPTTTAKGINWKAALASVGKGPGGKPRKGVVRSGPPNKRTKTPPGQARRKGK